jgi:hypothetical protein
VQRPRGLIKSGRKREYLDEGRECFKGANIHNGSKSSQIAIMEQVKGPFRLPISITEISHRSDFNPLKSVTCPISADRKFSIEIGSVANLKIKNLEIVNKTTNCGYCFCTGT